MPLDGFWIGLAAAAALLNWISADQGWRHLVYLTKPAVMLIMLILLFRTGQVPGPLGGFFAGAALGLAGDIFLMLPGKRTFFFGLLAFLAGHAAYIFAFQPHPLAQPWAALALAAALGTAVTVFGRSANQRMRTISLNRLRLPVFIYTLVLCTMVWSAGLTLFDSHWTTAASALVCLGALLFLVSDTLLGWDRFIHPLPHARLLVIMSYHLAQAGILLGAVLNL